MKPKYGICEDCKKPKYDICEDRYNPGSWRVGHVDMDMEYDDDSDEIAVFVGTDSKERAEEYLAWKNTVLKAAHPNLPGVLGRRPLWYYHMKGNKMKTRVCDICRGLDAETIIITVGSSVDAAGSIDSELQFFDLCPSHITAAFNYLLEDCTTAALNYLLDELDYPKGELLAKWLRDKQKEEE